MRERMSQMIRERGKGPAAQGFLPDFCANRVIFVMVLLAELFALVLALNETDNPGAFWNQLALVSLFVQWVVLGAAAALCFCKRWLDRLDTLVAALAVLGLTLLITLLFSLLGWWFLEPRPDFAASPAPPLALLVRNLAIGGIVTLIALRYFYVQHHWQRNVEAEARARLQALQARIHPHFLFNALNTIASLIPAQPERAEQAVLDLADMLRSALAYQERITLGEELELTRRYLAIERLRLGERLRVDWQLDDDLAARSADSRPAAATAGRERHPSRHPATAGRWDLDHPHRTTTTHLTNHRRQSTPGRRRRTHPTGPAHRPAQHPPAPATGLQRPQSPGKSPRRRSITRSASPSPG